MLNNEIWNDVNGLPYEVSTLGVVRRKEGAKYYYTNRTHIKSYRNSRGYECVNLYLQSKVYKFQVHRLVASAFIPNPDGLPVVNHKDGNPLNNHVDNLEWVTQSQNMKHAWDTGLLTNRAVNASTKQKNATSQFKGVSWSASRKKWCAYIRVAKKSIGLGRFALEADAARAYDKYVIDNDLIKLGYSTNFI